MKAIMQENDFGCAVACVAFVLNIKYKEAILLFENGENRAKNIPDFYCKEICGILGTQYSFKYVKSRLRQKIYNEGIIVFIKKTRKYKYGHYLVRSQGRWMDPWINLPKKPIKAGFRKKLPGRPIYFIYK